MAEYLAVDSGGTKVLAVRYDENFTLKGYARVRSMRSNTTPASMIRRNAGELIEKLFGGDPDGASLERVCGVAEPYLLGQLERRLRVAQTLRLGEGELGLCAAAIFGDGMMALSGTGATMFARSRGQVYAAGGYGAAVSDEGSGYWIARCAFEAAIRDYEGRGERTLLTEMIRETLGGANLREAIFSIYRRRDVPPVASVADCCPLVSRAAYEGDSVALTILRNAGYSLGKQLNALAEKERIAENVPVTVSGSVWKGHPLLLSAFTDAIRQEAPGRPVVLPEFEPVIGVLIRHYHTLHGEFDAEARARFRKEFADFRYAISNKEEKQSC